MTCRLLFWHPVCCMGLLVPPVPRYLYICPDPMGILNCQRRLKKRIGDPPGAVDRADARDQQEIPETEETISPEEQAFLEAANEQYEAVGALRNHLRARRTY